MFRSRSTSESGKNRNIIKTIVTCHLQSKALIKKALSKATQRFLSDNIYKIFLSRPHIVPSSAASSCVVTTKKRFDVEWKFVFYLKSSAGQTWKRIRRIVAGIPNYSRLVGLLSELRFFYSELLTNRLIESKISKELIMLVVGELPVEASLKAFFLFHFCLPSSFLGFPFKFSIKKIEVCRYQERMKAQQTSNTAEDSNGV